MAGRVSQVAVEAVAQPDDAAARLSHVVVEAIALPDDQRARVSQVAVEVLREETAAASPPRAQVAFVG